MLAVLFLSIRNRTYARVGWILSALKMEAISGMGLSLDGRYHDGNTPVAAERNERLVAGPCPRIKRELPWIPALEFRAPNPVSVYLQAPALAA